MAIKIAPGMTPSYGRITMPKGTFLSNPSTAADGSLGGGSGMNPTAPTSQIPGVNTPVGGATSPLEQYRTQNPVSNFLTGIQKQIMNQPTMLEMAQSFDFKQAQAQYGSGVAGFLQAYANIVTGNKNPTKAFGDNPEAITPPKNNIVGQDISTMPSALSLGTLQQILPGKSFDQIAQVMKAKGYEWVPYGGGFFANATGSGGSEELAKTQVSALKDDRGRMQVNPFELGPTLEPGERAVVSGGYGVTGGTPTESGQAQYAVTMPGQGDRWKYNIKQDSDGNWVRIYYRTNGRVNKRSQENRRRRAQERAAANASQPATSEVNELVTLRANYG